MEKKADPKSKQANVEKGVFLFFIVLSLLILLKSFKIIFIIPIFIFFILAIAIIAIWLEDYEVSLKDTKLKTIKEYFLSKINKD
ncbi:MAG TPA: hypothetical protein P5136_00665 [Methanofastidiosum sp.]|nr:hypothetical protein [Methanofastidiosum sp.]